MADVRMQFFELSKLLLVNDIFVPFGKIFIYTTRFSIQGQGCHVVTYVILVPNIFNLKCSSKEKYRTQTTRISLLKEVSSNLISQATLRFMFSNLCNNSEWPRVQTQNIFIAQSSFAYIITAVNKLSRKF